jgi:FkbM family methyltransferase
MDEIITAIEARLAKMEHALSGAHAVHMGGGRVLTRTNFLDLIFLVDGSDRLIVPRFIMDGFFEPEITSFLLENVRPDSVCVDVGANFGYYTCLMSRIAMQGRTIGIEADPETFEFLRDNVAINWLEGHTTILNLAASDTDTSLTLHRRDTRSGNTSIIKIDDAALSRLGEKPSTAFSVQARRLDSIIDQPVDFMKIDVEGAEPLVFRGAGRVIDNSPGIRIVMEWAPDQLRSAGADPAAFTEVLSAAGLRPHFLHGGQSPQPVEWGDVRAAGYRNLLLEIA